MTRARSVLSEASAPMSLWGEAVMAAAHTYNRTPLSDGLTPYQKLFGMAPKTSHLRVWGSDTYVFLSDELRGKFNSKFIKGMLVGYSIDQSAYRVLLPDLSIRVTRDVKVKELEFTVSRSLNSLSNRVPSTLNSVVSPSVTFSIDSVNEVAESQDELAQGGNTGITSDNDDDLGLDRDCNAMNIDNCPASTAVTDSTEGVLTTALPNESTTTRSGRTVKPIARFGMVDLMDMCDSDRQFFSLSSSKVECTPNGAALLTSASGSFLPVTYCQAMASPQCEEWRQAMDSEVQSLRDFQTFELVDRPKNKNVIRGRWVYTHKLNPDGTINKCKARFVAKGFTQKYGEDFTETHAPVTKIKSLRLLLSLATTFDLEIKQIDFSTAFLNAPLFETIYVEQPEGYQVGGKNKVWRLKKALY